MARLIIKNGYIKGGKSGAAHRNYHVKYIATRDGVEKIIFKNPHLPSTDSQKKLIKNMLADFPDSKNCYEYDDYTNTPSRVNASEFISQTLEQFVYPESDNEKYLAYIANRPRVEIVDTHGLFNGSDKKIVLAEVAQELSNHTGNVWTPIISLRREDADMTNYQTASAWRSLIASKVFVLADSLKIHPNNFKWFGAFHNESHHPHVHLICYSTNPNEGYLSTTGIEKMKSAFVNEIFKQQLTPLYSQKTERRDELKRQAKNMFADLRLKLASSEYSSPTLENLIAELSEKLKTYKGKKQYGYFSKPMKNLVDSIVDELAKEPNIRSAYDLWCELQNEIYHFYKDSLPEQLPLSQQKEFKSIKNMVIKEVLQIDGAEMLLNKSMDKWQNPSIGMGVFRLLNSIGKMFEDSLPQDGTTMRQRVDSKHLRKLRDKKQAQGQKISTLEENTHQHLNM